MFAFDATTNLPKTADAANITAYVSKDWGAVTVLADSSATEEDATNAKGFYLFDLTQAETNADYLGFSAKSSTANVVVMGSPPVVRTLPPNFTTASIDTNGRIKAQNPVQKNVALTVFPFLMTDAGAHAPATGKTVTCTRSIDGAAFGAGTLANVAEVANGIYTVDFGAGDLNGKSITLRATAAGCDDTLVVLNPST